MTKTNAKHEKFILALMSTSTIEDAAKLAKIARGTAFQYLRDPEFNEAYLTFRRETMQPVTANLQRVSHKALATLEEVIEDQAAPTSSRVQAARAILDNAYKGLELDDLIQRLAKIEERLDS